jgi:hypothetical protein
MPSDPATTNLLAFTVWVTPTVPPSPSARTRVEGSMVNTMANVKINARYRFMHCFIIKALLYNILRKIAGLITCFLAILHDSTQ